MSRSALLASTALVRTHEVYLDHPEPAPKPIWSDSDLQASANATATVALAAALIAAKTTARPMFDGL